MFELNEAETLFENDQERAAYEAVAEIDKIRVGHMFFDNALGAIDECLKASIHAREPVNCMLLGEGGMGKTSVARMVMARMKPQVIRENDLETRTVPAFYASFRSGTSLDALLTQMLDELGEPHPTVGKVSDKAHRFYKLLMACRTRIIFLDELHDLEGFQRNNFTASQEFVKVVKSITNECGPVTCLMGIPECHDMFDNDPEMSRRFKRKIFLRPLSSGTEETPGYLQGFLSDVYSEIVASTPIRSFPQVSYLNALQTYAATGGSLDFVMTMIKQGALYAMLDSRTHVEIRDYAKVWDGGMLSGKSLNARLNIKFNPFLASQAKLATFFREGAV